MIAGVVILFFIVWLGPARAADSGGSTVVTPPWLVRINMYRAMAQLPPLSNDPKMSEGSQNHAIYLAKNLADRVRDGTVNPSDMHTEAMERPGFSTIGRSAAPHCEVDFEIGDNQSQDQMIDNWIEGPLHRMLLLNPALERIGYGYYCEKSVCVQTINVVDGLAKKGLDADRQVAIEFPPANSTMSLYDLPHEMPDPLTACPGYSYPVGLPITFQIGFYVGAKLNAFSIVNNDDPGTRPLEACGYDAFSYRNEKRDQMGRVTGGLKAFSGVVVIPKRPLEPGTYRASITVNSNQYSWSFSIAPHDAQAASR